MAPLTPAGLSSDAWQVSPLHVPNLPTLPSLNTHRRPKGGSGCLLGLTAASPSKGSAAPTQAGFRSASVGLHLSQGKLATTTDRTEFVILRTGRSPPGALHLPSPGRSSFWLRGADHLGEDFRLAGSVHLRTHSWKLPVAADFLSASLGPIRKILTHLGEPLEPPPVSPAAELKRSDDPRTLGSGDVFDNYPTVKPKPGTVKAPAGSKAARKSRRNNPRAGYSAFSAGHWPAGRRLARISSSRRRPSASSSATNSGFSAATFFVS